MRAPSMHAAFLTWACLATVAFAQPKGQFPDLALTFDTTLADSDALLSNVASIVIANPSKHMLYGKAFPIAAASRGWPWVSGTR